MWRAPWPKEPLPVKLRLRVVEDGAAMLLAVVAGTLRAAGLLVVVAQRRLLLRAAVLLMVARWLLSMWPMPERRWLAVADSR